MDVGKMKPMKYLNLAFYGHQMAAVALEVHGKITLTSVKTLLLNSWAQSFILGHIEHKLKSAFMFYLLKQWCSTLPAQTCRLKCR